MRNRDKALINLIEADSEAASLTRKDLPALRGRKITKQHIQLIGFLRLLGATWEKIAEVLGVSRRTLYTVRLERAQEVADAMTNRNLLVPELYHAVLRQIRRGDSIAIQTLAKMLGELKERGEVEHTGSVNFILRRADWDVEENSRLRKTQQNVEKNST